MKFTLSWLNEHLETTAGLDSIVEALTRVGLEVEGVENPGEKLAAFAATGATLVIHLAIQSIEAIVAELTPVVGGHCPVAVIARLAD